MPVLVNSVTCEVTSVLCSVTRTTGIRHVEQRNRTGSYHGRHTSDSALNMSWYPQDYNTSCDMKPCAVQLACVSLVSMWFAPTRVVCVGGNVVQWSWPRHKGRHSPLIVLCLGHNARIDHNPDAKLKSILKA